MQVKLSDHREHRLVELSQLEYGWDMEGICQAPSKYLIYQVRKFLLALTSYGILPEPALFPDNDAGIILSWDDDGYLILRENGFETTRMINRPDILEVALKHFKNDLT